MDKKPTLISISGFCGTGKTTTAKIFAEKLPKVAVIRGDLPMFDAALVYPKEFENIFDMPLDVNDTHYSISKGVNKGASPFRAYLELVCQFVDCTIHREIERILANSKTSDTQHIVIEWGALPMCPIWEEADYRVMMDAPKDERNRKLYERPHPPRVPKEEYRNTGNIREEAVRDIMENAQGIDFHIYNTYDQNLEKDVEQVCQRIMCQKTLHTRQIQFSWRKAK